MKRTIVVLVTLVVMLTTIAPTTTLHAQVEAATITAGTHTPRPLPNGSNLGYYEYLPEGYPAGAPYPLVVFFHGIGERGNGTTELDRVLRHGPPKLIQNGKQFPAIVISPQLPATQGGWWPSITEPFVNFILSKYAVDPDRVYITGLSLGGGGTWDYAKYNTDIVAAIVPICGNGSTTGLEALRNMPIWAFHRNGDTVVDISATRNKLRVVTGVDPVPVEAHTGYFNGTSWNWRSGQLKPRPGERQAFTVYSKLADSNNHDAWTAAYNNSEMWDWLFAQRRNVVFQQDFQSSYVDDYVDPTTPSTGQFNDLSAEATGGTWSINQGRLQLARTGSDTTDNDAGITRHTDFAGPPDVLHVTFDLGASDWSNSTFQSGAMTFTIGNFTTVFDYGNGEAAVSRFETLGVRGKGPGQLAFTLAGVESAALAADGRLHQVALFLNKKTTAVSYRAPNGTLNTLRAGGVALWVNSVLVVETNAYNGSESTLTDFRIRFSAPDDATWTLDNIVIRKALPQ